MKKQEKVVTEKVVETLEVAQKETDKFTALDKKLYKQLLSGITAEISKVEKSYLNIAFKLNRLYTDKLYKIGNYPTIYDFAKNEYSLARGTCNNYINIINRFGLFDENGKCEELKPEFSAYSSSKLVIMVSMPDKLLLQVKPEMTVREIKELRRLFVDGEAAVDSDAFLPENEEAPEQLSMNMNVPESDSLMDYEAGINEIKVMEVDEQTIFTLPEELKEVLVDSINDFKKAHPQSKYRLAVSLVW